MRPTAVIFDWDNTLVDSFALLMAGHNAVRASLGLPAWSEAEARANLRLAAKDAFPVWYGERAGHAQDVYAAHIRANHLEALHMLDGAEALLEHLAHTDVPMAIVSNKRGEFLRAEIKHLGWGRYFNVVIGADDLPGPGKPDPAGILIAMEQLGVFNGLRGSVWYMGDTETDMRAAIGAGVTPVFVENIAMCEEGAIAALKPRFRFKDPVECLAYLTSVG